MERIEKKIAHDEDSYIQNSMCQQELNPPFGNLMSGWEMMLEGTRPDTNKGKERIYSRAYD